MHPQSSKPLLIYDNDCDFCRYWIAQWQHITGDRIGYAPYQEVAAEFPEIPLSAYENSVQLILQNSTVLSGAEAVFRALNNGLLLWCYYHLFGFKSVSEGTYRFVAQHRSVFLHTNALVLGNTYRANNVLSLALVVPASTRLYLSRRLSVSMGTGSWVGGEQRDITGGAVFRSSSSTNRNRRLLPSTNVVLVEPLRCLPPFPVCWRCCAVFSLNRRFLSDCYFNRLMDALSVACDSGAGFFQFPVGRAALRNRTFGNILRAATNP